MSKLGEMVLSALSRAPGPDYTTTTESYSLANALDYAKRHIPNFLEMIGGAAVLDYGCGPGWQSVAMVQAGARRVVGIDINERWLRMGRELAERENAAPAIEFKNRIGHEDRGAFDVVLSLNAMEHYRDPARELAAMRDTVKPGGRLVISFAEPWLSHSGSHMGFFTKVPWVNVFFAEKTVLSVRALYRSDGAKRFEEVEGGLNRMTLTKFERLIKASGMAVETLLYYGTKRLPLVTSVPLVREFLTGAVTCILRSSGGEGERGSAQA